MTRNTHRVIGQLFGGSDINCNNPAADYAIYGQFHLSWDYGTNPQRRLKDWLDPNNTGAQFVDGIPVPEPEPDPDPYVIHINGSFYQLNCPLLENQKVTVDHWGGAYDVCKNQEVVLEFTSNKKNLTCSLWDGTGPFYLQYFPRGDYTFLYTTKRYIRTFLHRREYN